MKSGAHILVKDSEDTQYLGDQKLLQMNAHENFKNKKINQGFTHENLINENF